MPHLTLGFSPCPNDTFMFGALVNGLIDPGEFSFEPVIEDVESLNRRALAGELDVSKLSCCAYAFAYEKYVILNSGSALGQGCGPLIVSKNKITTGDLATARIAIPGRYTTANLLTGIFFPEARDRTEMLFSEIEDAVASGQYDAGVIIHESRFTYKNKGLQLAADLGRLWEEKTKQFLPLGCIAARRSLNEETRAGVDTLIHKSISQAMRNPAGVMDFVRKHAVAMNDAVMHEHIRLYVNEFSLALTARAKESIRLLLDSGSRAGLLPAIGGSPFHS